MSGKVSNVLNTLRINIEDAGNDILVSTERSGEHRINFFREWAKNMQLELGQTLSDVGLRFNEGGLGAYFWSLNEPSPNLAEDEMMIELDHNGFIRFTNGGYRLLFGDSGTIKETPVSTEALFAILVSPQSSNTSFNTKTFMKWVKGLQKELGGSSQVKIRTNESKTGVFIHPAGYNTPMIPLDEMLVVIDYDGEYRYTSAGYRLMFEHIQKSGGIIHLGNEIPVSYQTLSTILTSPYIWEKSK